MKKIIFVVLVFFVFLVFAKIGGPSTILGSITAIDVKEEITTATVTIKGLSQSEIESKIKPGMSVRIVYSIETAQFRLPIGRIISVSNGVVTVSIDKTLLENDFENPYTKEKIKVKSLLSVGAEVSISSESA